MSSQKRWFCQQWLFKYSCAIWQFFVKTANHLLNKRVGCSSQNSHQNCGCRRKKLHFVIHFLFFRVRLACKKELRGLRFTRETLSGLVFYFLHKNTEVRDFRVSQKIMKIQKVDLHWISHVSYDPISLCMAKLNRYISHYLALKILCLITFILETAKFKHFILSKCWL